jgi:anaerobic selenocysteine-containing dehydrogenase
MVADKPSGQRIPGYCALCVSRCGSIAIVENGRFVALEPDPSHPTGKALCAKGRAAPELVYHSERLLYPLKRTRPKGDPDPGWQRISWDEALDLTAARLRTIAQEHGPQSVVFSVVSPSTSASDDSVIWIQRLMNAFGSPNLCVAMELCGWGRFLATQYTFGAAVPGAYMPDLEHAGCILFWGYNPNVARLSHAFATTAALKRGARLMVVDPRRVWPANRADLWLRVRPGTDAALALGIAHVMVERGWYDRDFIRDWTNGPLLVRTDSGRLLTQRDLDAQGSAHRYVAWSEAMGRPITYDPATGGYAGDHPEPALAGTFTLETVQGRVVCRPAFDLMADLCRRYVPERVEAICGIERNQVEGAARMLWEARPVAYYAWSGVEMQTNAQLYTLTGSFDGPGGNVLFPAVPSGNVVGAALLPAEQRARTLGLLERPLGPSRWQFVTTDELYRAILEQRPYPVRGLVGFGANLLLDLADSQRGRGAGWRSTYLSMPT